jgi:hypothetical protein
MRASPSLFCPSSAAAPPPWPAISPISTPRSRLEQIGNPFGIASKAAIYSYVLDRCNGMASETVRQSPEFRRLIGGAKAGLALIPKAIATRDSDLLHRILIELRSCDNLLAFRFG